jgi:hypothetical protein
MVSQTLDAKFPRDLRPWRLIQNWPCACKFMLTRSPQRLVVPPLTQRGKGRKNLVWKLSLRLRWGGFGTEFRDHFVRKPPGYLLYSFGRQDGGRHPQDGLVNDGADQIPVEGGGGGNFG